MNSPYADRKNTPIVAALAALVVALGLACILGWHTQSVRMIAWLPGKNAMVYNTAISFVFLGGAMLAAGFGRRRLPAVLTVVGGLPALLTLFEFVAGVPLGIDELLMKAGESVEHPGRIAPNTAVCLVLLSVALLCSGHKNVRSRTVATPLLASVAWGLSAVSLAGHLTGFATYGWSGFIPMAVPTSVGLVLLSLGVLGCCWRDAGPFDVHAPSWLYMAVTVAAMVMTLSLWQALASDEHTRIEHTVAGQLEVVRGNLLAGMQYRIAAVARFARRWEYTGLPDEQRWQFETRLLIQDVQGFQAIAWADPTFRIRWIYPLERNEALLGADLSSDVIRRTALEKARDSRRTIITPPIRLLAGGKGINAYVPVYRDSVLRGFIVAGFRFQDLAPIMAPGYAIAIYDGDEKIYFRAPGDQPGDRVWAQQAALPIENIRWTLLLWPTHSALAIAESTALKILLAAGLLLSLVLGAAVFLAQAAWSKTRLAERARRELEKEIDERRRAEQELNQFFTLAPDMLCIAGFDGYLKRVNEAWERVLGVPLERLLAEPFKNFIHPDDVSATQEAVADQKSGMRISSFENRYRAVDGSYRLLRWNSLPTPERQLIFAAARDVTAEKAAAEALLRAAGELEQRVRERTSELELANQALHEREELFRRLFEESPVGTALVGLDYRLTNVNRALCELLAYDAAELRSLTPDDITHHEDQHLERRLFEETITGQVPGYRLSKRYLRKGGEIVWGDLTATTLRDQCGSPVMLLSMIENVTERRRRDDQIARLNQELRNRVGELTAVNQELESFNYSISHDLRAPLRHIDGFSKIMLEQYRTKVPDGAGRYLEQICEGAKRMGRMVDELLELSRTSRKEMARQSTGLRSLVDDVVADLGPDLQERDIEWRIGDLPFVECDPTLVRQVFANLLSNAVKFTRPRKRAIIEVGHEFRHGEKVLFVRDNGVGFNMKYTDKLFGVFQRLHRREEFEGTGVGLATVQRIIHKHGGRIWAEAALDQGAAFYFTLDDGRIETRAGSEEEEIPVMSGAK